MQGLTTTPRTNRGLAQPLQYDWSKVGFPIRKSLDQSSFAAPQGLSQRTTSFIASQRQGIHQMLLRHLIALMIDVRCERQPYGHPLTRPRSQKDQRQDPLGSRRCMLAERIRSAALADDPDAFPLHDVKHPRRGMTPPGTKLDIPRCPTAARRHSREGVVELDGIEPTTSCLQSTRSPN